jgi:D-alanine-D-alanine ligase
MSRTRVAIVRGGPSEEYDVSLRTGSTVLAALDKDEFEPLDIVITKSGEWLLDGRARYPEHIIPSVDVVFNALHGTYGEDGTFQRLLDRYGVPYTGSKAYASGIAMHKVLAKEYVRPLGILTPRYLHLVNDSRTTAYAHAETIRSLFGPQYFIKPISSGSSVGMRLVFDPRKLADEIEAAFKEYNEILVEERIEGREVTCGVIERYRDEELYALPPIEIVTGAQSPFFNYDAKYSGETDEICPAPLPIEVNKEIENAAKKVHEALNLSQYSRSDFILGKNGLYFLEVNTLPGLTSESLLPKAIAAVGGTYRDFVTHLINDARSMSRA